MGVAYDGKEQQEGRQQRRSIGQVASVESGICAAHWAFIVNSYLLGPPRSHLSVLSHATV